jgi:hypothetical protein
MLVQAFFEELLRKDACLREAMYSFLDLIETKLLVSAKSCRL